MQPLPTATTAKAGSSSASPKTFKVWYKLGFTVYSIKPCVLQVNPQSVTLISDSGQEIFSLQPADILEARTTVSQIKLITDDGKYTVFLLDIRRDGPATDPVNLYRGIHNINDATGAVSQLADALSQVGITVKQRGPQRISGKRVAIYILGTVLAVFGIGLLITLLAS